VILRYQVFLLQTLLLVAILAGLIWSGDQQRAADDRDLLPGRRQLVGQLMLTDFAIWTEARYTRHPSQADLFTPFQDFPGSLEHFPAGSLLAPPASMPKTRLLTSGPRRG
jgi:hypothetical protein